MTTANTTHTVGDTRFTLSGDRELIATRAVDAPRETVWAAWTSPKHIPHWMLGPEGSSMPVCEIDFQPGGEWHYQWRGADGSTMDMRGVYEVIDPPDRLVSTESWGGDWPETVNTLVLTEEDGKTTMTCTLFYPSKEAREKALDTGMEEGWSQSYDRLDDYLPTIK